MSNPKLTYYHPNTKGTGAAIEFLLEPAHFSEGDFWVPGGLFVRLARQNAEGFDWSFDWSKAIEIRLDINDLSKMIEVFRGMSEGINDGKGLLMHSSRCNIRIMFEHRISPYPGYALEIMRRDIETGDERRGLIVFTPAEAVGLSLAIEQSMGLIAWGAPKAPEAK